MTLSSEETKPTTSLTQEEILLALRELYRQREAYRLHEQASLGRTFAIISRLTECERGEVTGLRKALFSKGWETAPAEELTVEFNKTILVISSEKVSAIRKHAGDFEKIKAEMKKTKGQYEKKMSELIRQLFIWPWASQIRGVAELSLACIVAETVLLEKKNGDLEVKNLGDFGNPAKLWKRFGIGIVNGEIQREVRDTQKAIDFGYCPRRRAVIWRVGDCLAKLNDGKYRAAFESRKVYEYAQAEKRGEEVLSAGEVMKIQKKEVKLKVPKAERKKLISRLHINRRCMRYISKLFLKDLWIAWRELEDWPKQDA